MKHLVFDAGALIALERGDRRMLALLDELLRARRSAHVPAGVVAQVWRGSPRQHAVLRLLRSDAVRIHPMGEEVAFRVGLLLAATGTHDVVDAHVAILGRSLGGVVLTSDADDLRQLDPKIDLVAI